VKGPRERCDPPADRQRSPGSCFPWALPSSPLRLLSRSCCTHPKYAAELRARRGKPSRVSACSEDQTVSVGEEPQGTPTSRPHPPLSRGVKQALAGQGTWDPSQQVAAASPRSTFPALPSPGPRTAWAEAATHLRSAAVGGLGTRLACTPLAFGRPGLTPSVPLFKPLSIARGLAPGAPRGCVWGTAPAGGSTFAAFLPASPFAAGFCHSPGPDGLQMGLGGPWGLLQPRGLAGDLLIWGGLPWGWRLPAAVAPSGFPTRSLAVLVFPWFAPGFLGSESAAAVGTRGGCTGWGLTLGFWDAPLEPGRALPTFSRPGSSSAWRLWTPSLGPVVVLGAAAELCLGAKTLLFPRLLPADRGTLLSAGRAEAGAQTFSLLLSSLSCSPSFREPRAPGAGRRLPVGGAAAATVASAGFRCPAGFRRPELGAGSLPPGCAGRLLLGPSPAGGFVLFLGGSGCAATALCDALEAIGRAGQSACRGDLAPSLPSLGAPFAASPRTSFWFFSTWRDKANLSPEESSARANPDRSLPPQPCQHRGWPRQGPRCQSRWQENRDTAPASTRAGDQSSPRRVPVENNELTSCQGFSDPSAAPPGSGTPCSQGSGAPLCPDSLQARKTKPDAKDFSLPVPVWSLVLRAGSGDSSGPSERLCRKSNEVSGYFTAAAEKLKYLKLCWVSPPRELTRSFWKSRSCQGSTMQY